MKTLLLAPAPATASLKGLRAVLSSGTSPALQMALNRLQDFLLARVFGDVERDEAAFGEPDISDDRAVGSVVEVKEGTRFILERARSPASAACA